MTTELAKRSISLSVTTEIDVVTLEDESEPGVEPSDDVQPASRPKVSKETQPQRA